MNQEYSLIEKKIAADWKVKGEVNFYQHTELVVSKQETIKGLMFKCNDITRGQFFIAIYSERI